MATTALACCTSLNMVKDKVKQGFDKASAIPIYIGIAIAIAAVVFSLFTGTIWGYLIACLALTINSCIGVYHAFKPPIMKDLAGKIDVLKQVGADLNITNTKFEKNVETLEADIEDLEEINHNLETNVDKFKTSNKNLVETNKKLETTNKNLETNVTRFTKENENLTNKVTVIEQENTKFAEENTKLALKVTTLEEIINQLKQIVINLDSKTLELGKGVEKASEYWDKQAKEGDLLIESLKFVKDDYRSTFIELIDQLKSATEERRLALIKENTELTTRNACETEKLEDLRKQYEILLEKFQRTHKNFEDDDKQIRESTKDLKNVIGIAGKSFQDKLEFEKKHPPSISSSRMNQILKLNAQS